MPNVEVVHVGIVVDGAPLAIMQVVANDYKGIDREVTDEVIDDEITRAGLTGVVRWKRIDPASIPKDRSRRDQWRLEGDQVVTS